MLLRVDIGENENKHVQFLKGVSPSLERGVGGI